MQTKPDLTLLDTARRLGPLIQEHRDEAEREGRLSRPVLDALHETGLLRMFTPKSLGGLEVDPITRTLIIEEVAAHDTAAAWTLANPLDWAHFCARLPDEGAEEIYEHGPKVLIAAQFGRPLTAIRVDGGFTVTGRAPFVSNCLDANWIAMTAIVTKGNNSPAAEEPEVLMVYFPKESCEVIDNWDVLGMRGTGSHDISATDVFVPASRTFPFVPKFNPGSHYKSPLYQFPLMGVGASNIPPVMFAVARNAVDEVSALAQGKTPVASSTLLRDRATAQSRLAQAEGILRSARLLLYDTMDLAWQATLAEEEISLEQKANLLLAMAHASSSSVQAVELVYKVAGTSGIRTGNPLERSFRDIQMLRHHAFAAETRFETVGQVYLGLPPDFPGVMF
jgi:alkylation response protein AidB-like acyl-CoA dehydrogenase